jgi:hypothetical protein
MRPLAERPADPVRIHEPGRTAWIKLNVKS